MCSSQLIQKFFRVFKLAVLRLGKTALDRGDGVLVLGRSKFRQAAAIDVGVHHYITAMLADDGDRAAVMLGDDRFNLGW